MPGSRLLVLGLDGATFDVIEPLARQGRLPVLDAWRRAGAWARLASTLPPMSFPAWSTFQTGLSPGEHGLFDFTQKLPGAYRIRFTNASDRTGASLFARVSRAGGHVLALGMPATFPPEPVNGLLVAGFDAPVSTGSDPRMANDAGLYRAVAARAGPWMQPDVDESAREEGWHERTAERLLARIERKRAFTLEALAQLRRAGAPPDLVCVVFSESDTAAHHFWRDHDPHSPRHDPAASAARKGALAAVYEKLDAACGEIRAAFGEDALCVVVSDHGSGGAARRVVHLGRRLEEAGLLRRQRPGGGARPGLDLLARSARDAALRLLGPRLAQQAFRRARAAAARLESAARFGGVDWSGTAAFSEEANTQPGVWINLRGREERGCVAVADYERVRDEVIACLGEWSLPGGGPVVARARRREEVHPGPHTERAPDVVVELADDAGYGLSLVATPWSEGRVEPVRWLEDHELAGGRGRGMNGTHRPDGVWIAHGPGAERCLPGDAPSLRQVAPALLGALGIAADADLAQRPPRPYTADEEERVAARLRALGYLE